MSKEGKVSEQIPFLHSSKLPIGESSVFTKSDCEFPAEQWAIDRILGSYWSGKIRTISSSNVILFCWGFPLSFHYCCLNSRKLYYSSWAPRRPKFRPRNARTLPDLVFSLYVFQYKRGTLMLENHNQISSYLTLLTNFACLLLGLSSCLSTICYRVEFKLNARAAKCLKESTWLLWGRNFVCRRWIVMAAVIWTATYNIKAPVMISSETANGKATL